MQLYRDYHQVYVGGTFRGLFFQILAPAKCWFWQKLGQEVTRSTSEFQNVFWTVLWLSSDRRALLYSGYTVVESDICCRI